MYLFNISKHVDLYHMPHCWQLQMHKPVSPQPQTWERRIAALMYLVFSPFGPMVDKEELFQDFFLILALVNFGSKLKQHTY